MSGKGTMVQGTSSSAGKSLLVVGLCRMFAVTATGSRPSKLRIWPKLCSHTRRLGDQSSPGCAGRGCGIEPSVDMNPYS